MKWNYKRCLHLNKRYKPPHLLLREEKFIRRMIPFPAVPKVLPEGEKEEDDEDEEGNLPLNQRTHLERAIELEQRRSSIVTPPSIPK